ncbi:vacuolar transporter 6 [Diaporthe amygdali]|uniref:vacuolar transporter 6 n=1 Tax=Phomopsis amygdali TaxID=1214568 RepID=UPI0022FF1A3D|nr:vacuolar transporter 6 [Diaporthe amygdali]KAJ0122962.1 vacuolar transporter 6 [Diaporthe amygdali]
MARRPKRGRSPKGGGQASMMSSNINLLNTIVGAGTLAMPHAMSQMGMLLGTFIIVWSGITSAFGLYLQARCARYLDRGSSSFFALSQLTYPNAAVIFDAAIAIKCFGVAVSYLIIIGDLMPGVIRGFNENADRVPFLVDRNFWITAFMLIIIPLSFLRRLDSLKYTSVIALISIGYLIVLVVYHFASDSVENRGDVSYIAWNGPVAFLSSLPVVVFAYTCHQNMFSVINEIKDNTPASIVGVISSSIGSAASIYVLVAITGYLTFGNTVLGNIVMMYPSSVASTIGKAAIVVLVMFSVPLQVHPCRASLDAVLRWRPNRAQRGPDSPSNRSLLPTGSGPTDSHGAPAVAMSDMRFALLTTVIIVLAYITSLTVSQLDRVLAYVGATGSTSISFILPGLFYYKISDPDSIHHQRLTKEDDDVDANDSDDTDIGFEPSGSGILEAAGSIRSGISAGYGGLWRMRKRWRWDMEHIEHGLLRRLALCLAIYGMCVMVVCLVLNTFFTVAH